MRPAQLSAFSGQAAPFLRSSSFAVIRCSSFFRRVFRIDSRGRRRCRTCGRCRRTSFKLRGPNYYPNFYLIIADSGAGLAIDCGLIKPEVLDEAISGMKEKLGLKHIDAVIPTHNAR